MQKLTSKTLFIISFFININAQDVGHLITFFITPYPDEKISTIDDFQADQLCNIINCHMLNLPINFGIFCTYLGYMTYSNYIGQVIFPRKTVKDSLNLLITNDIEPIFMLKNTIAYWKIFDDASAKMYKLDRKQDNETKLFYWNVQEKQLPKKNKIPLHTIIILANPDDIFLGSGIIQTTGGPQLVLPNIYIKYNKNYVSNALFTLSIKPFFSQIKKIYNERPIGYAEHIIE